MAFSAADPFDNHNTAIEGLQLVAGSTYVLTAATDILTGTSDDDTFLATSATLSAADVINGGAGTDTFSLLADVAGPHRLLSTSVEIVKVQFAAFSDVFLNEANDVIQLEIHDNISGGQFWGLQESTELVFKNTQAFAITVHYEGGAFGGADGGQAVSLSNAEARLRLNTNVTTDAGEVITSLSVTATSGESFLFLDALEDADVALASVTVTGPGYVEISPNARAEFDDVSLFDASGSTGGVLANLSTSTKDLTVSGGSGNDRLDVALNIQGTVILDAGAGDDMVAVNLVAAADLTAIDRIRGGDGTGDVLRVTSAVADLLDGADNVSVISGFEILRITNALANDLDISKFGINHLQLSNNPNGNFAVSGFTSGATVEYRVNADSTGALIVGMTDATLAGTTSDTLNVLLNADLTDQANAASAIDLKLTVDGINIINVTTADRDNANNATSRDDGYILSLSADQDVSTINVSGSSELSYTSSGTDTALATIDASALTGDLIVDLALFSGMQGVAVTGGSGTNTLTGGPVSDRFVGGASHDMFDGGAGIDTVVFSSNRADYTTGDGGASVTGPDGTDTVSSIERYQFSDVNLAFDLALGEAAGNTVRIIGAAFGSPTIGGRPDYVGIGVDLFDGGTSMLDACALVVGILGLSDAAFVNRVFANVVGRAPTAEEQVLYVGLLASSGGPYTQAQLLEIAASVPLNETAIDLVGLQQTGVEFA